MGLKLIIIWTPRWFNPDGNSTGMLPCDPYSRLKYLGRELRSEIRIPDGPRHLQSTPRVDQTALQRRAHEPGSTAVRGRENVSMLTQATFSGRCAKDRCRLGGIAHCTRKNTTATERAGLAVHFLHTDYIPQDRVGTKALTHLTGPLASGGVNEYGKQVAGTWQMEVDRVLGV